MKLTYREKISYVIFTEDYSNTGVTREELIETAKGIYGVGLVEPAGINDEIIVHLYSCTNIHSFLIEYERKLNILIQNKEK